MAATSTFRIFTEEKLAFTRHRTMKHTRHSRKLVHISVQKWRDRPAYWLQQEYILRHNGVRHITDISGCVLQQPAAESQPLNGDLNGSPNKREAVKVTRRSQHSQESKDPRGNVFCNSWPGHFDPKINRFPRLIV